MADSAAFSTLQIQAHAGPYTMAFEIGTPFAGLSTAGPPMHLVIDARVADLYRDQLRHFRPQTTIAVDASETAKSLERCPAYVERLVAGGIRRDHALVAIGGGVIQDIVCFLAAITLRGVAWQFYPTTLLAQADSCIGSKSSINVGGSKNIVGTFTPPRHVVINARVLDTLSEVDRRSGIGEMLKVHAIDGPEAFERLSSDYDRLDDPSVLTSYIEASLRLKQRIVELDEFDRGPRRVMNYGHSFGHAIESATDFAVPHGIAITIGMDMANWVAAGLDNDRRTFERMHRTLSRNAGGFEQTAIPLDAVFVALGKDKKNTDGALTLVLPDRGGRIGLRSVENNRTFRDLCAAYFAEGRAV
jgi:3-dehydroquinate synthase